MKIKDIKANQGKIEVSGTVSNKSEVRTFNKFGREGRVASATLSDESGSIKLTLWNEQVDQVGDNDKIKIENGYASEYQGEVQLSTGKFGRLSIIEKAEPGDKAKSGKAGKIEDLEEDEFESAEEESFDDF
ncbi:MAG: SOSS complex subunit B family protein [Candidatus Woesearchaeota archaeon]